MDLKSRLSLSVNSRLFGSGGESDDDSGEMKMVESFIEIRSFTNFSGGAILSLILAHARNDSTTGLSRTRLTE